ncbi:hypothetical protein [Methanolobus sp. ZRKC5]|uniref:hypothetical protein n=1 Tax=unclassified Methanolobus TaxID=2629569 RepID=UPI00313EA3F7
MDEYEIGVMSTVCKIRALSIESAILGFALRTENYTNMGLDTLSMIMVYSVNGEKFEGVHPFVEISLEDIPRVELMKIRNDINGVSFLE